MRPADRGKQQRIRLRGSDAVKARVDGHLRRIAASPTNLSEFKSIQSFSNLVILRQLVSLLPFVMRILNAIRTFVVLWRLLG